MEESGHGHLPEGAEENYRKLQSGYAVSWLTFEWNTSRI
jgi:hypothetical protein